MTKKEVLKINEWICRKLQIKGINKGDFFGSVTFYKTKKGKAIVARCEGMQVNEDSDHDMFFCIGIRNTRGMLMEFLIENRKHIRKIDLRVKNSNDGHPWQFIYNCENKYFR